MDDRGTIVKAQVRLVVLRRIGVAMQPDVHITELFLHTRGCRIQFRGGAQVVEGRCQRIARVAAVLMRFGALQIGEHRLALQGDGAAERLDCDKGLAAAKRLVALGNQTPVLPVALHGLVGKYARHGQPGQQQRARNGFFHI